MIFFYIQKITDSGDELKDVVERGNMLKPLIEKLDEMQKKVYLTRCRMCGNMFTFILETRENN